MTNYLKRLESQVHEATLEYDVARKLTDYGFPVAQSVYLGKEADSITIKLEEFDVNNIDCFLANLNFVPLAFYDIATSAGIIAIEKTKQDSLVSRHMKSIHPTYISGHREYSNSLRFTLNASDYQLDHLVRHIEVSIPFPRKLNKERFSEFLSLQGGYYLFYSLLDGK